MKQVKDNAFFFFFSSFVLFLFFFSFFFLLGFTMCGGLDREMIDCSLLQAKLTHSFLSLMVRSYRQPILLYSCPDLGWN